jgi:hypothetical protein
LKDKKYLRIILLIGLVALPLALLILPVDFFDHGEVLCPSKRFLDMECPGCGITRGVQHAIHFDFKEAWEFNKLTFIVLTIALFYWLHLVLLLGFNYHLMDKIKGLFKRRSKHAK